LKEQSVIHNTFVIERSYPKPPQAVFAAFSDAAKKRRWFGEAPTQAVEQFDMDFREGGRELFRYRMNESTPFPGVILSSEGHYLDIVPGERLVMSLTMELGGRRISAALVTVEFLASEKGTDMIFVHQGAFFEGSGGPEMREMGWNSLFERLATEMK
jgi:uncharacterized protein YndB with AHSA1/START domain